MALMPSLLYVVPFLIAHHRQSLIDAWIDWTSVISLLSASWLYPVWGLETEDPVTRDVTAVNLFRELTHLNTHLTDKSHLVGTAFSLADLSGIIIRVSTN